jgi:hypothetical protein
VSIKRKTTTETVNNSAISIIPSISNSTNRKRFRPYCRAPKNFEELAESTKQQFKPTTLLPENERKNKPKPPGWSLTSEEFKHYQNHKPRPKFKKTNGSDGIDRDRLKTDKAILIERPPNCTVEGPIIIPPGRALRVKKHIYRSEKDLRDIVIAHTPEGKRVFAFNDKGYPICFSRLGRKDESIRCQSPFTMFPSGRCSRHGGSTPRGRNSTRNLKLREADSLPINLRNDWRRASLDDNLLDLSHEIKLADLQIKELKTKLNSSLSKGATTEFNNLMLRLQLQLEKEQVPTKELLKNVVDVWTNGKSTKETYKLIHEVAEHRRKLAESAFKREKELKTYMGPAQTFALITSISATLKETINTFFTTIENDFMLFDASRLADNKRQQLLEIASYLHIEKLPTKLKMDVLSDIGMKFDKLITGPKLEIEEVKFLQNEPVIGDNDNDYDDPIVDATYVDGERVK